MQLNSLLASKNFNVDVGSAFKRPHPLALVGRKTRTRLSISLVLDDPETAIAQRCRTAIRKGRFLRTAYPERRLDRTCQGDQAQQTDEEQ
jgi:hypothetical protein